MERLRETTPNEREALPSSLALFDTHTYIADAENYSYDPRPFLEMTDVPVIYMFDETDINVPTAQSVDYQESFRREFDKDIDIVVFDGVGHSMANWTGLFTGEYAPEFLEHVGSWCAEQVSGKPAGN